MSDRGKVANRLDIKWEDYKHINLGFTALKWPFERYWMTGDRLFMEKGVLTKREYELRLYRITNINLTQNVIQKMLNIGTVHIDSIDKDLNCFSLINVFDPAYVKEMLSQSVEEERKRNGVASREFIFNQTG